MGLARLQSRQSLETEIELILVMQTSWLCALRTCVADSYMRSTRHGLLPAEKALEQISHYQDMSYVCKEVPNGVKNMAKPVNGPSLWPLDFTAYKLETEYHSKDRSRAI